ncbi:dihydrodipicolinate synthase family protein [Membranihabitans marinus]|uniref:dihydrodipicolinate synthase family protein n=1 Tax=Membranihabitans marinus TaxID=1227546 RepID=UPI001EFF87E9|nr:dihydrodipicolinate synthase family protein [Membranihabitans marinus]
MQNRRKFLIQSSIGISSAWLSPNFLISETEGKGKRKALAPGLWAVMITPFDEKLNIDYPTLKKMIQWYEEAGVAGFFANCASSEMYQLSPEQRVALTKFVVENTSKPVVSTGSFSNSVDENIAFIKEIYNTGVDAVVLITSVLVEKEKDDEALWQHIKAIVDGSPGIPLGLYECPSPYKRLLSTDILEKITATDRFVYLKDTSCDAQQVAAKIATIENSRMGMYNAHTPDALFTIQNKGQGLSPIGANFYPEIYAFICKYGNSKRKAKEVAMANEFLLKSDKIIGKKYPVSAKCFMNLRGLPIQNYARRDRGPFTEDEIQRLKDLWVDLQKLAKDLKIDLAVV